MYGRCVSQNKLPAVYGQLQIDRELVQVFEYLLSDRLFYSLQVVVRYLTTIPIPQRQLAVVVVLS